MLTAEESTVGKTPLFAKSYKVPSKEENVEDASEYELDQPDNTITVTTEDGETTVIQLGMENDSTSQEYIDLNKDSSKIGRASCRERV